MTHCSPISVIRGRFLDIQQLVQHPSEIAEQVRYLEDAVLISEVDVSELKDAEARARTGAWCRPARRRSASAPASSTGAHPDGART